MHRLEGGRVYLAVMERADCMRFWNACEYDGALRTEPMPIGLSAERADAWFEEIQRVQGEKHVRLGVFLPDGRIIGCIALQDIDWRNGSCTLGMDIARIADRGKGYGQEAIRLLLGYAFEHMGLARVAAHTLDVNLPAQRALERAGFAREGVERGAVAFGGRRHDRIGYGLLASEWQGGEKSGG